MQTYSAAPVGAAMHWALPALVRLILAACSTVTTVVAISVPCHRAGPGAPILVTPSPQFMLLILCSNAAIAMMLQQGTGLQKSWIQLGRQPQLYLFFPKDVSFVLLFEGMQQKPSLLVFASSTNVCTIY